MLAACLPLLLAAPLVAHTPGPVDDGTAADGTVADGTVETDTVEVVVQLVDPFYRPIPNGIVRLGTTEAQTSYTGAGGATGIFHAPPGTFELVLGESRVAAGRLFGATRSLGVPPLSTVQPRTGLFSRLSQPMGFPVVLTAPGPGHLAAHFRPDGQIPFWTWITLEGHGGRIPLHCGTLQQQSTIESVLRYYGHSGPVPQYSRAVVFETDGALLDAPVVLQVDLIDTTASDGASFDVHHFAPNPPSGGQGSGGQSSVGVVPPVLTVAPNDDGYGFLCFGERLPAGLYVVAARPGSGAATFHSAASSPPTLGEPNVEVASTSHADRRAAPESASIATGRLDPSGAEAEARAIDGCQNCVVEPAGAAPGFTCPAPGPGAWSQLTAFLRGCPIHYDGILGCHSDVAPSSEARCGVPGSTTGIERTEEVEVEVVIELESGGEVSTTKTVSSTKIEAHAFQPGVHGCGQCYQTFARVDGCVHGYTTHFHQYVPEHLGGVVEIGSFDKLPCAVPHSFTRLCTAGTTQQETCDRTQAP